ncbi:leucine-rich repeat domain-containing protein [Pseudomonas aeruginosa]|uniref:leucine-rich repeat domain-containing protein n=1 Tax=Pseudomonas aeruginosa TaxID=287 RepID=UPI001B3584FA|nr:leucine-rich repeat domain-containing protein [Pseudomonas aeruginosa]MBP8322351.1 leucine-rich repeat domain-containing protein [Pseudomonas aeruginosa]
MITSFGNPLNRFQELASLDFLMRRDKKIPFFEGVCRWKERNASAGMEHASEAARRLIQGGQYLDLSNMDLTSLPDDAALPAGVRRLNLSGNRNLESLSSVFFSESSDMLVDISGTRISADTIMEIESAGRNLWLVNDDPVEADPYAGFDAEYRQAEEESSRWVKRMAWFHIALLGGAEAEALNRVRPRRMDEREMPARMRAVPQICNDHIICVPEYPACPRQEFNHPAGNAGAEQAIASKEPLLEGTGVTQERLELSRLDWTSLALDRRERAGGAQLSEETIADRNEASASSDALAKRSDGYLPVALIATALMLNGRPVGKPMWPASAKVTFFGSATAGLATAAYWWGRDYLRDIFLPQDISWQVRKVETERARRIARILEIEDISFLFDRAAIAENETLLENRWSRARRDLSEMPANVGAHMDDILKQEYVGPRCRHFFQEIFMISSGSAEVLAARGQEERDFRRLIKTLQMVASIIDFSGESPPIDDDPQYSREINVCGNAIYRDLSRLAAEWNGIGSQAYDRYVQFMDGAHSPVTEAAANNSISDLDEKIASENRIFDATLRAWRDYEALSGAAVNPVRDVTAFVQKKIDWFKSEHPEIGGELTPHSPITFTYIPKQRKKWLRRQQPRQPIEIKTTAFDIACGQFARVAQRKLLSLHYDVKGDSGGNYKDLYKALKNNELAEEMERDHYAFQREEKNEAAVKSFFAGNIRLVAAAYVNANPRHQQAILSFLDGENNAREVYFRGTRLAGTYLVDLDGEGSGVLFQMNGLGWLPFNASSNSFKRFGLISRSQTIYEVPSSEDARRFILSALPLGEALRFSNDESAFQCKRSRGIARIWNNGVTDCPFSLGGRLEQEILIDNAYFDFMSRVEEDIDTLTYTKGEQGTDFALHSAKEWSDAVILLGGPFSGGSWVRMLFLGYLGDIASIALTKGQALNADDPATRESYENELVMRLWGLGVQGALDTARGAIPKKMTAIFKSGKAAVEYWGSIMGQAGVTSARMRLHLNWHSFSATERGRLLKAAVMTGAIFRELETLGVKTKITAERVIERVATEGLSGSFYAVWEALQKCLRDFHDFVVGLRRERERLFGANRMSDSTPSKIQKWRAILERHAVDWLARDAEIGMAVASNSAVIKKNLDPILKKFAPPSQDISDIDSIDNLYTELDRQLPAIKEQLRGSNGRSRGRDMGEVHAKADGHSEDGADAPAMVPQPGPSRGGQGDDTFGLQVIDRKWKTLKVWSVEPAFFRGREMDFNVVQRFTDDDISYRTGFINMGDVTLHMVAPMTHAVEEFRPKSVLLTAHGRHRFHVDGSRDEILLRPDLQLTFLTPYGYELMDPGLHATVQFHQDMAFPVSLSQRLPHGLLENPSSHAVSIPDGKWWDATGVDQNFVPGVPIRLHDQSLAYYERDNQYNIHHALKWSVMHNADNMLDIMSVNSKSSLGKIISDPGLIGGYEEIKISACRVLKGGVFGLSASRIPDSAKANLSVRLGIPRDEFEKIVKNYDAVVKDPTIQNYPRLIAYAVKKHPQKRSADMEYYFFNLVGFGATITIWPSNNTFSEELSCFIVGDEDGNRLCLPLDMAGLILDPGSALQSALSPA